MATRSATTTVNAARLLVVEDDASIRETIDEALRLEGFQVQSCANGAEALGLLTDPSSDTIDLIILDLMLPGLGGLDLCRQLRALSNVTPILVVSARDSETDRVLGLEVGADDYLVKPFSIEELLARLRALQRRVQALQPQASEPDVLRIGDLELNQANHDVRRGSRSIQLSNKEYQLLVFLMRSPNKVQSRLEILHGVWGESFYGDDNLLDVYIRYLRQKVESAEEPKLIHTVRGVGFMMRLEETSS